MKKLYFDMDGTICDLYAVPDWLSLLKARAVEPYYRAKPMISPSNMLKLSYSYELHVITWTAKNATTSYHNRIADAKKNWLIAHYGDIFKSINIIPHGTSKADYCRDGLLIDDDLTVLEDCKVQGVKTVEAKTFRKILNK